MAYRIRAFSTKSRFRIDIELEPVLNLNIWNGSISKTQNSTIDTDASTENW